MEESFYFALLRISMTQILKASGFDKCKPSVLNTVTELYIKHLESILASAKKFSISRANCTNEILPQDLVQALLDVQLIKPSSFESILDPRDSAVEPPAEYNTKSLESFVRWLKYSDSFRLSKQLCEVPTTLIHNLVEKRKIDISAETDQERKKRRLREKQEYYNQFKHGDEHTQVDRIVDDLDDDEITSNDRLSWLAYLTEKDLKLGHNLKFANTCISDTVLSVHKNKKFHPPSKNGEDSFEFLQNHLYNNNKNDYVVLHIQDAEDDDAGTTLQPSRVLKESLPYNVKYSEALLDDNVEQYFEYAEKHPEEIEKIRESLEKAKEETATNGRLPSPLGLSGEEKPVVSVLKEVADIDVMPSARVGDVLEGEEIEEIDNNEKSEDDKEINEKIDKNGIVEDVQDVKMKNAGESSTKSDSEDPTEAKEADVVGESNEVGEKGEAEKMDEIEGNDGEEKKDETEGNKVEENESVEENDEVNDEHEVIDEVSETND